MNEICRFSIEESSNNDLIQKYQICFEKFLKVNNLQSNDNDLYVFTTPTRRNLITEEEERNNTTTGIESLELLDDPLYLENNFSKLGFEVAKPLLIINTNGNTLFISAGVQIIDDVIHNDGIINKKPKFVSQPVLRTQYIDSVCEGSSTSFINISTEAINVYPEDHFYFLQQWLKIFTDLGMEKTRFTFKARDVDKTWGNKTFNSFELFVYYDDIEIGDGSFNYNVPQNTRGNINFSDIGFGLERIKWILNGGSYFNAFTTEYNNELTLSSLAYANTLSLLSGSGLKPSNKEYGYRFRLFSKRFVDEVEGRHLKLDDLFIENYNYWSKWTKLQVSKSESLSTIKKENSRNFNRLLLDQLLKNFSDVNLDINLPTDVIIERLSHTSVDKKTLKETINNLHYKE